MKELVIPVLPATMAKGVFFAAVLVFLVASSLTSAFDRAGRRVGADGDSQFKSTCGSSAVVSHRVAGCMEEVFDLIFGRITEPKSDQDIVGHCDRFSRTEKCARNAAKDCLGGLHKTAVGAVASATRRFRSQECKTVQSRAKYMEPLKCAMMKGPEMTEAFKNHTALIQGIRDLKEVPEQKLMKMCCVLNELDRDIERRFDRTCPKSTPLVMLIVHAMTDDARSTLCVAPKCKGALDKVINNRYKPPQNLIEPIMEILFQLNVT